MYFSQENLEKLKNEYETISDKYKSLMPRYLAHNFVHEQAREYARHGFSRRLGTLYRCVENVFRILPPNRTAIPTADERSDAVINLQAFVFNIFGCAENLAWIWVREKSVTLADGSPIPDRWVGLGKKNKLVRDSFSPEFLKYLEKTDAWFEYLENFRHSLAHRIPLYVPPYVLPAAKEAEYLALENAMNEAMANGESEEYERLSAKQKALGGPPLFMTHSFGEKARKVVFHAQLLADFNTIEELGTKMLDELNR